MIRYIKLYTKLLHRWLTGKRVCAKDISRAYDDVASTYDTWLSVMGKHTRTLIDEVPLISGNKVLDLACGTGYISNYLFDKYGNSLDYTAVDISESMIKDLSLNENIETYCEDVISFLNTTDKTYDLITIGWALPYFKSSELYALISKVLNPNGIFAFITNVNGTLLGVEEAVLKTMSMYINDVDKILTVAIDLPKNKDAIKLSLSHFGFNPIYLKEGEEFVYKDSPEDMYRWLRDSGAISGTKEIFKRYDTLIQEKLTLEVAKRLKKDNSYRVNHKFVQGIFKKEDLSDKRI